MRFREGLDREATAFFGSIAFDELWSKIALQTSQTISQSTALDATASSSPGFR
jgi:hypothetical protein